MDHGLVPSYEKDRICTTATFFFFFGYNTTATLLINDANYSIQYSPQSNFSQKKKKYSSQSINNKILFYKKFIDKTHTLKKKTRQLGFEPTSYLSYQFTQHYKFVLNS